MLRPLNKKHVPLAALPPALLAVALLLYEGADVEREAAQPRAPHTAPAEPRPQPGAPFPTKDTLVLRDGRRLEGEILRQGPEHVVLRHPDGRIEMLSRRQLSVVHSGPPRAGRPATVRLRSGRTLPGVVLATSDDALEVRLGSGTVVTLRASDVEAVDYTQPAGDGE